jgi:predicted lactoylglutathione lyase
MSPYFIILYVEDPAKSEAFYAQLLGRPAIESSPTFVMFAVRDGLMLGLWISTGVKPEATPPGGMEFAITVGSKEQVDSKHSELLAHGVAILQSPVMLDFGYTCVAKDPDGHRIRIFAPGAQS